MPKANKSGSSAAAAEIAVRASQRQQLIERYTQEIDTYKSQIASLREERSLTKRRPMDERNREIALRDISNEISKIRRRIKDRERYLTSFG